MAIFIISCELYFVNRCTIQETYYGGDLTSHYCLRWMSELLQKARRENLTQAEGSLFSSYGCERVRAAPPTSEEYFPAEMVRHSNPLCPYVAKS